MTERVKPAVILKLAAMLGFMWGMIACGGNLTAFAQQTTGKSLSVPLDRGRTGRKTDFRRYGCLIARICREAGLRFLTKSANFPGV